MVVTKWDHTESPEDELLDLLTCHRSESWSVVYVSHLHLFSRLVFWVDLDVGNQPVGTKGNISASNYF